MRIEISTPQVGQALLSELRRKIDHASSIPEEELMHKLMAEAALSPAQLKTTQALAAKLAIGVRKARLNAGGVDMLTQEFSLDSREGVALMCLAEAMLRIPDTETRNMLIRDKIVGGDWRSHVGQSPSLFVNATAWGLLFTGKLLKQPEDSSLAEALTSVLRKGGEAAVRAGVAYAMRLLGRQFVTGQSIEEAINFSRSKEPLGYRYSFDMLGEAALTAADAQHYYDAYLHAIDRIGKAANGRGVVEGPGVSVKLSGLHPRYEVAQRERVLDEMYPKLLKLAQDAKKWKIGFHLDQEESARFDLTLEMLERLASEPSLSDWGGLGISLQAYQKRGRFVAEWIISLARAKKTRICVRLVKGAYWDTEIKRAQSDGTVGFPVFTRKVHSDVSYLACAKVLLSAPDAVFPQFATHNAFSIAAAHTMAGDAPYEFQCLHGMGETVYDQVVGDKNLGRCSRVYAPVGPHETLLAYLVRRLLENGANSSFVNQVVDEKVSIDDIVADPVAIARRTGGRGHPQIVVPEELTPGRRNAAAVSLGSSQDFLNGVLASTRPQWTAAPLLAPSVSRTPGVTAQVRNPGQLHWEIGVVEASCLQDLQAVVQAAVQASCTWRCVPAARRAELLEAFATHIERRSNEFGALLVAESGQTLVEAAEEVRQSVSLCRLLAQQLKADMVLQGVRPHGVAAVISSSVQPMFTLLSQVAPAIAMGNTVVVKPATHACLTAHRLVQTLHEVGVAPDVCQLVIGGGDTIGAALLVQAGISFVSFAGTNATSKSVRTTLFRRADAPVYLAHTAGLNVLIADSSSLPEQVISDVISSGLVRAGQQATALKVLCVQDVVADGILKMLRGMLSERHTGHGAALSADMGALTGPKAVAAYKQCLDQWQRKQAKIWQATQGEASSRGHFVVPTLIELSRIEDIAAINVDLGGPVVFVVRWSASELARMLGVLNAHPSLQGLSLHTRIDETTGRVLDGCNMSALHVNRAVHTLVPGLQPAGGGAESSGIMLGGGMMLHAYGQASSVPSDAAGGPFSQIADEKHRVYPGLPVFDGQRRVGDRAEVAKVQRQALREDLLTLMGFAEDAKFLSPAERPVLLQALQEAAAATAKRVPVQLPALVGEENTLLFRPRGNVLCLASSDAALLQQVATALGHGNSVTLMDSPLARELAKRLPGRVAVVGGMETVTAPAAILVDDLAALGRHGRALLDRCVRSVPVACKQADGSYNVTALRTEMLVSVNVSAAGGNSQLMMIGEEA